MTTMTCPRCNAPADEQTLREFGGVCPKCLLDFSEEQDAPAFPNLEILEMIGQGGMGVVYKARQKNLDRIVALKVLSPQLSDDPEFVERFTREAKALAQLSHPNIVGIHDSGIHDRVPYLVMEFIDGTPLRKMLASGKMTPDRALEVIPQICDALQYAHTHGVVHRDIKPENILLDRQGRVKIADFGLAKLSKVEETRITQSGYVMGTPRYMAPEQFEASGRVDHRADIYSLGVVFYEMLTGEVPMGRFKPPSAKADVDRRLDPVVLRSLEREPEDRYQSAGAVKDDVTGLKRRPLPVPPAGPPRPHPLRRAAAIILVLSIAALGIGIALSFNHSGVPASIALVVGLSLPLAALVLFVLSFFVGPRGPAGSRAPSTGGCLLFVVAGLAFVLVLAMAFLLAGTARVAEPPRVVTAPVVVPPERPRGSQFSSTHSVRSNFDLEKVWPTPAEFPAGSAPGTEFEGKDALRGTGLPDALPADLQTVRRINFGEGRVVLLGVKFSNEIARRQWSNDPDIKAYVSSSQCRLDGESNSAVYLWHDGSIRGTAIAETLWPIIERKWQLGQPRNR